MNTHIEFKPISIKWQELTDLTDENTSLNFLIPKIETYYRSKAFVSQISINPLIASSAPLFFLIEKIKVLPSEPDIDKLRQDLIYEMNAFEHQAQIKQYRPQIISAAQYVLCLWIDETILNSNWGSQSQWRSLCLVDYQNESKEAPFYVFLTRCCQDAEFYIDLLELFYLCLSLGFQGINTTLEPMRLKINETRDLLFEIIHKKQANFSRKLEIDTSITHKQPRFFIKACFKISLALIAVCILISTYYFLNKRLDSFILAVNTQTPATTSIQNK